MLGPGTYTSFNGDDRVLVLARGDEVSAVDDSTVRRQLGLKG